MIADVQFLPLLNVALSARPGGQGRAILEGYLAWTPLHLPTLLGLAINHAVLNDLSTGPGQTEKRGSGPKSR
jgi:hypothetical protein